MLARFFNEFYNDPQGRVRNWRDLEEEKINELFRVTQRHGDETLDAFKLCAIPTNVTTREAVQDGNEP